MKTLSLDKTAMNNPSEFKSALSAMCPKCRTGNMFANKMYQFGGQKMHSDCPHCGFHFEIEPGYFYVAMFISYAMNVAEMVTLAVATYILTGNMESPWLYITILLGAAFALAPFNFRYSRVILLYWLTPNLHYDPKRR
jgi:uncharacterized protein (DUF983 family)